MKVIIAGSRHLKDPMWVPKAVENSGMEISELVCGMAAGVDTMAYRWAKICGISAKEFWANWNTFGRSAGSIRNGLMADYADALIAIWDGASKGTGNMIDQARRKGLQVYIERTDGQESMFDLVTGPIRKV